MRLIVNRCDSVAPASEATIAMTTWGRNMAPYWGARQAVVLGTCEDRARRREGDQHDALDEPRGVDRRRFGLLAHLRTSLKHTLGVWYSVWRASDARHCCPVSVSFAREQLVIAAAFATGGV